MILAIVKDLFFESKIKETAFQLKKDAVFIKNKAGLDDFFKRYGNDKDGKENNKISDDLKNIGMIKNIELMIIDLNFDEIIPLETIQKIKNNKYLKNKKIIAYCPHIQAELMKKAKELGAEAMPRSLFAKRLAEMIKQE